MPKHSWDARDRSWGPGCPRRVRKPGSGGDCRLQRRMTTPAPRKQANMREPVYKAASLPRAAARAAP